MISSPLIPASEVIPLLGQAVFLDARAGPDAAGAYATAHVAGAIRADLENDLSEVGNPTEGGRHPLPSVDVWLARLGAWGIAPSTPVIVYDAAGGGMAAARAWWMLHAVGHESLAVVDGGWQARCVRQASRPTRKTRACAPWGRIRARSMVGRSWTPRSSNMPAPIRVGG